MWQPGGVLTLAGAHQHRPASVTDRDHEPLYDQGLLLQLSAATRPPRVLGTYRVDDALPGHALKGIARSGGGWLACTERELLWVDEAGEVARRWTHPLLNDVHHALEHDGTLWVASTGADAVLEVRDGEVARVHALGGPLPDGDLRTRSLKPHQVHPNHLFAWDGEVWVTCLHPGHARALRSGRRLEVDDERIHDGVVHAGRVWFTTVDGRVVITDGHHRDVIDLNTLDAGDGPLGWCRGLVVDGERMWVGFTRLRATRWRHHLAWVRGRLRGRVEVTRRPTRVVEIDLTACALAHEVDLEPHGVHAVFGLDR